MNVLVVGSYPSLSTDAEGEFKLAAEELGKALAKGRYNLIVASDKGTHIDKYVLKGFLSAAPRRPGAKLTVFVTQGDPADIENNPDKFSLERNMNPQVSWEPLNTVSTYPFNRVFIVKKADIVIIVGGADGTGQMAQIAFALEKVIIPLLNWVGPHKGIWDQLEQKFRSHLDDRQYDALAGYGEFDSQRWTRVLNSARVLLAAREGEARPREVPTWALLGFSILFVFCWFGLFLSSYPTMKAQPEIMLVILLFISSIIGVTMRASVSVFSGVAKFVQVHTLLLELCLSFAVTFVAFLMNSGLTELASSPPAFRRAAISISLLGFTVSFLLELSVLRIREALVKSTAKAPGQPGKP